MRIETPPSFKGKTSEWRDLEEWLRQLRQKVETVRINGQTLTLPPLPSLSGGSDDREWNSLSRWLSVLHSQIGKPYANAFPSITKRATTTLTVEEIGIVFVDSTLGTFTITLPQAAKIGAGGWFFVKDLGNATANNITIDTIGAETIDGAPSITITVDYGIARCISLGTNWGTT